MLREEAEIAILGSGFAGSLLSLILKQIGRRAILIEKGRHPRFAIGESSTPLANLALESLCQTYGLQHLLPLTKYGSWQKHYGNLACGLKRGFSFFKHVPGREFQAHRDHATELLVAASPSDEVGDTHWYREQFDHFLVQEVQKAKIPYLDRTEINALEQTNGWTLCGRRQDEEVQIKVDFLVDASGSGSAISAMIDPKLSQQTLHTNSWTVYSHFVGVRPWEEILDALGGQTDDHPFRCDDAALHHILDEGWMWLLRFNNGITSAGIVFDGDKVQRSPRKSDEHWPTTIRRYPSIARQFENAQPVQPLAVTSRLQRCLQHISGTNWVRLPHSAYFLDPLLSAGIAHSLLGVERLAQILEEYWAKPELAQQLAIYSGRLHREIEFLDRVIHGSYQLFTKFELFTTFSMYYFAGAVYQEHQRRQGFASKSDAFLFSHDGAFRSTLMDSYKFIKELQNDQMGQDLSEHFMRRVASDIAPYNVGGLCTSEKHNMYPYI